VKNMWNILKTMKCGGTMAKENGKKTTEEQLKEAFGQWQSAIDTMRTSREWFYATLGKSICSCR